MTSRFLTSQLKDAALKTGIKLFGPRNPDVPCHGLTWSGVYKRVQEPLSYRNNQSLEDCGEPTVYDDYEYVFFPSRPGEGLDVSNEPPTSDHADVDGLIYSYWATEGWIYITDPSK